MHEWSESQQMIREAVRRFVEGEIAPHVEELEHGDLPPYDLLRKMYAAFGMDEMAGARFDKQIAAEKRGERASVRTRRVSSAATTWAAASASISRRDASAVRLSPPACDPATGRPCAEPQANPTALPRGGAVGAPTPQG